MLFDDPDELEKRRFPVLHKIVLGLAPKDLESELQVTTANVNDTDLDGRTALSWAAARSDHQSVLTLLKYGADSSLPSNDGFTPLHWAARASDATCLAAMVQHGANVNTKTKHGSTPLHQVALFQQDPSFVQPLLNAGVDIYARRSNGDTALICSAEMNNAACALLLLEQDADIEERNYDGTTVLLWAISHNAIEVADLLIERGADYRVTNNKNETILHIAAQHANTTVLTRLTGLRLSGIDKSAQQLDGFTAMDLAARRSAISEEWDQAFERFLRSVNQVIEPTNIAEAINLAEALVTDIKSNAVVGVEEVGADCFVDAVEHQTSAIMVAAA